MALPSKRLKGGRYTIDITACNVGASRSQTGSAFGHALDCHA
ncbi:hypothetical protein [Mesorhizobium carmichaelinearum]|nr:hypothetical protein [Mesorhizobium carmichaelinearum]